MRALIITALALLLLDGGTVFAQDRNGGAPKGHPNPSVGQDVQKGFQQFEKNIGVTPGTGSFNQPTPVDDFVKKIEALKLSDFQYALALANSAGNQITVPCWQAWVDLLSKQQAPLKDANGQPLTEPDPHVIVDLEIASEWLQELQPNSAISRGCAPLAQAAQKDIGNLIGAVLAGGATGLLKFPFALP